MSMSGTVVEQSTRKPLAEGLNPDVSTGKEKNGEKCKKKSFFLVFGSGRKKKKEIAFCFSFSTQRSNQWSILQRTLHL
jgi:hypothetical protein